MIDTKGMFQEECSLYRTAKDRQGIGTIKVADFLFGGRWREQVMQLRAMIAQYGAVEAKKRPEYKALKQSLPGATLSGLFSVRRTDSLIKHTGYLVLDIDKGDNEDVSNPVNIAMSLRFRPEVACYMKSCSGTGLFALVRLAYPEKHKEQFAALFEEYKALGITLDKACSDITRIRFASYDDEPYINEHCVPYRGIYVPPKLPVSKTHLNHDADLTLKKVDAVVRKIECNAIDVTGSYKDAVSLGMALHTLGPIGKHYWQRLLFFRGPEHSWGHTQREIDETWARFNDGHAGAITIASFFFLCAQYGIEVKWSKELRRFV